MFQRGTKDLLLMKCGIPYGYVMVEGRSSPIIFALEKGQTALKYAVEQEILTADETKAIELQMVENGVLPTFANVVDKVKATEVPAEFLNYWDFKLCGCAQKFIKHGHIHHHGEKEGSLYVSLQQLFEDLRRNVDTQVLNAEEAVLIFQKAATLDLPLNDEEADARFAALPAEDKEEFLAKGRVMSMLRFLLGGDGDVPVITIRVSSRATPREEKASTDAPPPEGSKETPKADA